MPSLRQRSSSRCSTGRAGRELFASARVPLRTAFIHRASEQLAHCYNVTISSSSDHDAAKQAHLLVVMRYSRSALGGKRRGACRRTGKGTSRPLQPIRKDLVIRFRRQRLAREAIMAAKEISVKKYVVRLSGEERERLETLIREGKSPARRVLKARILMKADVSEAGQRWNDNRIIEALETSSSIGYRVRKQLVEESF